MSFTDLEFINLYNDVNVSKLIQCYVKIWLQCNLILVLICFIFLNKMKMILHIHFFHQLNIKFTFNLCQIDSRFKCTSIAFLISLWNTIFDWSDLVQFFLSFCRIKLYGGNTVGRWNWKRNQYLAVEPHFMWQTMKQS